VPEEEALADEVLGRGEWTFAVDVGDRSVGLAAVAFKDEEPTTILAATTVIHDGGVGDEQKRTSRLAERGEDRRTRRLRRRRKARLRAVEKLIRELGWVVPPGTGVSPYDAWAARSRLVTERVVDERERAQLLGLAVTHVARHRGWRNPWLGAEALWRAQVPSDGLRKEVQEAEERFETSLQPGTVGQLGALLIQNPGLRVNPREATKRGKSLLGSRTRQEDLLWELQLIAEQQGLPEELLRRLAAAIFHQYPATVPVGRIGKDPLDPTQVRAPVACLEFQEFRVRSAVANLRIRSDFDDLPLTVEQRERVTAALLGATSERLTWGEVALDVLGLEREDLLRGIPDEHGYSSKAPHDATTAALEAAFTSKGRDLRNTKDWWKQASRHDRADLVGLLVDSTDGDKRGAAQWIPDAELEELASISLPSGRAAYSRRTLRRLNEAMEGSELDLHGAIEHCFGVGDDWRPPLPTLDEVTGQPTVDRNLAVVRKFLSSAVLRWGPPARIVVELAREGEKTPARLWEEEQERERRRRWNDKLREELRQCGIAEPSRADLVKHSLLSLYGNQCLYCGDPISWESAELDHIVPRRDGGANVLGNLAAVCARCNRAKNHQPFGAWAKTGAVDLETVVKRVQELLYEKGSRWSSEQELRAYQQGVVARLRRVTPDPEEVRSLAPTSYAAVALRDRLKCFMEQQGKDPERTVAVFRGGVTAAARQVLRIRPTLLPDRSRLSREVGKRIDRRHHAIDAIVLTTLTPGVARLLEERSLDYQMQRFWKRPSDVDLSSWERHAASSARFTQWREVGQKLVELLKGLAAADRIPVIRPLRLRPSGQLHEKLVARLQRHRLGDAWSKEEIRRVVDPKLFSALSDLARHDGGSLQEDDSRRVGEVGADDWVELFPWNCAMMHASTGAVKMGSIHHARIYAWKSGKGKYQFGMVRVWLGDLAACGLLRDGVDVLTAELPPWSQSWRHADAALVEAVDKDQARYISWLAHGDEIWIDPEDMPDRGHIRSFLEEFPERHWFVRGFEQPRVITLGPLYLADEGLPKDWDASPSVKVVMEDGWRPAVSTLFGCPSMTVIRRTALGRPRWQRGPGNLPESWKPWERARKELG